jgi:hypothetical protein
MILELSILIIGIVIMLCMRKYRSFMLEPFSNEVKNEVENESYLYSCPSGYKSYHLKNGNTACCKGEIIANECMSDDVCLLNGKGTADMKKCTAVVTDGYKGKSNEHCPASMSSYYEDASKKGCTNGPLNTTMTGPLHPTQATCIIYDTLDMNITSLDSCYNQKEMDDFPAFGTNSTKSLVQAVPNAPVQVSIGFVDSNGMHRVAYTRASMQRFLDATKPTWRNQGMDLDKNINVAEVAKAYYVDRTILQEEIQL